MLQKTKVVKRARKALEALYDGTCTITEHQKVKKPNGSTGFHDVPVLTDQPCRISYKTVDTNNQSESGGSAVVQVTELFISPEVDIKPGSKITVTQHGQTVDYQMSGKPAMYDTHQEVILDLFKEWS